jgi:hypothetical protein
VPESFRGGCYFGAGRTDLSRKRANYMVTGSSLFGIKAN